MKTCLRGAPVGRFLPAALQCVPLLLGQGLLVGYSSATSGGGVGGRPDWARETFLAAVPRAVALAPGAGAMCTILLCETRSVSHAAFHR